jgi:hypothetical protein
MTQQRNVNIEWHGCQIEMSNKGEDRERSMFQYVAANIQVLLQVGYSLNGKPGTAA